MKFTSYKTAYNRHIRECRKWVSGASSLERAELIAEYFRKFSEHPHVNYTYTQLLQDRTSLFGSDHKFCIGLMKELADLAAKNEKGYDHKKVKGLLLVSGTIIGGTFVYGWGVRRYHDKGGNVRLLQLESFERGVQDDDESIVFDSHDDYKSYMNSFSEEGADLALALIRILDKNRSNEPTEEEEYQEWLNQQ